MQRKCNCNSSSVQANFVKRAVYVPLSTYYKCTNLQVVKALVRSAAQPRANTVILQNRRVSSSKNKLYVHRTPFGCLDPKFQKANPYLRGATPPTSYPMKSVCALTCVYSSKLARAMVHRVQLDEGSSHLAEVRGNMT